MQPLGKYPYLGMSKKQIRRAALKQLLFVPLIILLPGINFIFLFLIVEENIIYLQFMEIFFPERLINKSKNELARDMGRLEMITKFHHLSTKRREKYKVR